MVWRVLSGNLVWIISVRLCNRSVRPQVSWASREVVEVAPLAVVINREIVIPRFLPFSVNHLCRTVHAHDVERFVGWYCSDDMPKPPPAVFRRFALRPSRTNRGRGNRLVGLDFVYLWLRWSWHDGRELIVISRRCLRFVRSAKGHGARWFRVPSWRGLMRQCQDAWPRPLVSSVCGCAPLSASHRMDAT